MPERRDTPGAASYGPSGKRAAPGRRRRTARTGLALQQSEEGATGRPAPAATADRPRVAEWPESDRLSPDPRTGWGWQHALTTSSTIGNAQVELERQRSSRSTSRSLVRGNWGRSLPRSRESRRERAAYGVSEATWSS